MVVDGADGLADNFWNLAGMLRDWLVNEMRRNSVFFEAFVLGSRSNCGDIWDSFN